MKKQILMVSIFAVMMIATTTRSIAQKGFSFGLEGAPQLAWLRNTTDLDNSNYERKDYFNAMFGISTHYGFSSKIGLGLNAYYSFQGQRYKFKDLERIRKVEYLKIPLLFTYTYEINSNLMLIGKVGPQLGLLMNASLTDKDGSSIVDNQKKAYLDYDIGGLVCAGVGFKLNENFYFDAGLKFDYGFTNAEDKDHNSNINNPNVNEDNFATGAIDRASTSNITAGVLLGFRYVIQ